MYLDESSILAVKHLINEVLKMLEVSLETLRLWLQSWLADLRRI